MVRRATALLDNSLVRILLGRIVLAFAPPYQFQKTQGFCIANFATLSDERRSRSKFFLLFIWLKEPCVRKFGGLARSKLIEISQTVLVFFIRNYSTFLT